VVLADSRIDQFHPVRAQPGKRALLIGLHEPAIADHVGSKHCGEPMFHTMTYLMFHGHPIVTRDQDQSNVVRQPNQSRRRLLTDSSRMRALPRRIVPPSASLGKAKSPTLRAGRIRTQQKAARLRAAFFELVAGAGFEPTTFRL
jgi:hypothetical protein